MENKYDEYPYTKYDLYPVTIVKDRYGHGFCAFMLKPSYIPECIFGGDNENFDFWGLSGAKEYVGIGSTPDEALSELFDKFKKSNVGEFEYEDLTKDVCKRWE